MLRGCPHSHLTLRLPLLLHLLLPSSLCVHPSTASAHSPPSLSSSFPPSSLFNRPHLSLSFLLPLSLPVPPPPPRPPSPHSPLSPSRVSRRQCLCLLSLSLP